MNKPLLHHKTLVLEDAQEFIKRYHRHSKPLKRHRFSIGAFLDNLLVGVVSLDNCSSHGWSKYKSFIEIRRNCIKEDVSEKNVSSYLLDKAIKACFAMGFDHIITYTKPHENGASLKALGFYVYYYTYIKRTKEITLLTWVISRSKKEGNHRGTKVRPIDHSSTENVFKKIKEFKR